MAKLEPNSVEAQVRALLVRIAEERAQQTGGNLPDHLSRVIDEGLQACAVFWMVFRGDGDALQKRLRKMADDIDLLRLAQRGNRRRPARKG